MAEETTVFKLEFDIPEADKRAEREAERRPAGVTPRMAREPRRLQSKTEIKRSQPGLSGARFQRSRDRSSGITPQFAGRVSEKLAGATASGAGALGAAVTGGVAAGVAALASQLAQAAIFAQRNAEKIRALATVIPVAGAETAAELATIGAVPLKAILQTASDSVSIVKALGAIGSVPAATLAGLTENILALYKVNAARAGLMLDASDALWDNRTSAATTKVREILSGTAGAKNLRTTITEAQAQADQLRETMQRSHR